MESDSNIGIGCTSDKVDFSSPQIESYQEIKLTGDDENNTHLVSSKNVTIITPPYNRCSSSNRVKINNIVDYTWEPKYQFGHLVASTIKGNYFAYSLLAQRVGGVVRVMKYKTEQRILIKDFKGHLRDLAFAYTQEVILACIDEYGNLEVHEIEDDGKQLRNIILLRLDYDNDVVSPSSFHLLFWCPFIPDDPNDIVVYKNDEPNSTLLAVTHNNEVEVINVKNLSNKYGPNPILTKQLPYNQKILIRNPKEVTVATFSPDGTALATGSLEGDVNFYEMKEAAFEKDEVPSCIHEWKPHDGKPISALFFLDNHKYHQPEEQFWKFALTGADYNQEIKLWSCETWDCLQTISFTGPIEMRLFQLKAELDATGGYLLLSDLFNKSIYVLQIYQNNADCVVNVCSIAEFPMTHSILSIAPVEAIKCRIKITDEIEPSKKNDNDQNGEEDDEDDSAKELSVKGIAIRCFWISTKSLQESRITYQPPVILPYQTEDTLSLLSQDSVAYRDPLSELSVELQDEPLVRPENDTILKLQNRAPSLSDREDLLLTPNDFASPSHGKTSLGHSPNLSKFSNPNSSLTPSSVPLPPISPTEELNLNTSVSSLTNSSSNLNKRLSQSFGKEGLRLKSEDLLAEDEEEEPLATSEPLICRKLSQRSSGSSPSQEVADIMGPVKPNIVSDLVNIQSQTNGVLPTIENPSPTLVVKMSKESDILSKDFGSWPQAPDLSKEYKLISQTTDKPSFTNQALLGADNSILNNTRLYQDIEPKLAKIEQALQTLIKEMNGLSNIKQQQALEIQSLQQQLNKSQDQTRYFQNLNHRLDNLEGSLSNHIQKALSDQSRSDYNNVENLMSRREDLDRQWMEKHFIQASNNANSAVGNKLDKAVKNEMKTTVLPGLSKSLDGFKESLHQDLIQRLSFSENAIKENMNKLFKNKAFIDSITQNVQINVQSQVPALFKDVLHSHLMPAFEKICQNLFIELNETFKQGTKDYLQQAERSIERYNEQAFNSLNHQLQAQSTLLNKNKDLTIQTIHHEITSSTSSMMESLLLRIRPTIAEEVRSALKEHFPCISQSLSADNGGFLSRTMTPIPNAIDYQKKQQLILQYLRSGHYNSAFQEALNAVDLDLVMFVCENVSPTKVFGQVPCPLKQPVVLSLVHQLGTNLNDKIDLKISYLEEALMTLDPTDPLTHNHLPTVIGKLRTSLTNFLQLNPTTSHLSKIKMIVMATNSLSLSS